MINTEESLSQKFIRKWSWIFLFTLLTAPLGYIIRILLTGNLSPSDIGIIYGSMSFLALLSVYNDFGLTESLNYFLPKYIIKKDYARCKYLLMFAFKTQFITSIILGGGVYMMADFLSVWHFKNPVAKDVLQIMALFFLGLNLMQVATIIFSASQDTKLQKGIEFFRMFMTVVGIGWLTFLHQWNIINYVWAWVGAIYVTVFFAWIIGYSRYYKPYFYGVSEHKDHTLRKTFIKYSLWTFVWANIWVLLHQLDQQILQNMTNSSEWWIYAMYLSLIGIPFIILSPILAFLFPVVSAIPKEQQKEKVQSIHAIFSNTMCVIALWASAMFLLLGKHIAIFLYGSDYAESGNALLFIAPFLFLNVLIQINFQIMAGIGMVRERVYILGKTLLLNVSLVIILILGFQKGILPFPSAASATSFAVWFSWILMWILSYQSIRPYHGKIDWKWLSKNILTLIIWLGMVYVYNLLSYIPHFGTTGRLTYLIEIGFVFWWSIIIFLLLNLSEMRRFVSIVQSVRKSQ